MADFKQAFKKVVFNEGGYVNDPDDAGGETFMGITRKNHPNPVIWDYIDKLKAKKFSVSRINSATKLYSPVMDEIRAIYKIQYWDKFKLDTMESQCIAEEIFDCSVNCGETATKNLISKVNAKLGYEAS